MEMDCVIWGESDHSLIPWLPYMCVRLYSGKALLCPLNALMHNLKIDSNCNILGLGTSYPRLLIGYALRWQYVFWTLFNIQWSKLGKPRLRPFSSTTSTQLLQMTSHFRISDKQVVILLLPCPVSYVAIVKRMIADLIFVLYNFLNLLNVACL